MSNLLRRLAPAVALTGTAVAVVTLFDPGVQAFTGGNSTAAAAAPVSVTTTDNTDGATKAASRAPAVPVDPSQAPAQASTDCSTATTYKGPVVDTRWGPVQVTADVAGGKVCSADALQYPDGDGRSQMISQYSVPLLNEQAVAHNGEISGVSGASYTSQGYARSMQALLQSAH